MKRCKMITQGSVIMLNNIHNDIFPDYVVMLLIILTYFSRIIVPKQMRKHLIDLYQLHFIPALSTTISPISITRSTVSTDSALSSSTLNSLSDEQNSVGEPLVLYYRNS